jgi:hypothetical protein
MAWKPAPAPIFEHATSALYASNDGRLEVRPERQTVPPGFVVTDTTGDAEQGPHVQLFTRQARDRGRIRRRLRLRAAGAAVTRFPLLIAALLVAPLVAVAIVVGVLLPLT